jgi:tetratricopeptide (TPR) repeat protein
VLARSLVPQQRISGAVRRNICVFKLHEFYNAGAMAKETVSVRRRVFVVMPFGKKEVPRKVGNEAQPDALSASEKPLKIDFDEIYAKLLAPALEKAGCQPFRADQEEAAGDIRRDMFFELVTGDIVLADISILNANVFYELGVRHGVAPRGVLCVHAGWSDRPFDVAPDRTFRYDGKLFEPDRHRDEVWEKERLAEVDTLASTLAAGIEKDVQTIGSPVYSLVDGLRPADISGVRTQRATYFNNIADDWTQRVAVARKNGCPEDILTLAGDVPTPLHRRKLLRECAKALVELGRFVQAEEILNEVLSLEPEDFEARCQLALVINRLGQRAKAEEALVRLAKERPGDSEAQGILGRVYKDIWRSTWSAKESEAERQLEGIRNAAPAVLAIKSYNFALRQNLASFYNGVNVVSLLSLLNHLADVTKRRRVATPVGDLSDLPVIVRIAATSKLEDPGEVVWAKSTLGELSLATGKDAEEALAFYEDAIADPSLTYFNVKSMLEQVELFTQLGFQHSAADPVRELLMQSCEKLGHPRSQFPRVFVASGHMIDHPDRPQPRFPRNKENSVRAEIARYLDTWKISKGDLALCGGARGADILFAEECLARGALVRLLLALPEPEFIEESVILPQGDGNWVERFRVLLEKCDSVAYQDERLGDPPSREEVFARNNMWTLNTARVQGGQTGRGLYALLVWDENPAGDGIGGTSDFARRVAQLGADYRIINPTKINL